MYTRLLKPPKNKSFFLFGPRGTGKTTWLREQSPVDVRIDLLDAEIYQTLIASPSRLAQFVPTSQPKLIAIDEVQRVPDLLQEVHRLIEEKGWRFALTGSSARKLRRSNANLLAGRALSLQFFPLVAKEMGDAFSLADALQWGNLPGLGQEDDKRAFLKAYVQTYLREEIQQEGLARNVAAFARFLEAASFSQASVLNVSAVAREAAVDRKVVEDYFSILEDLMIGTRLPPFQKRAKRRIVAHPKFFFFDVGVYRAVRPQGPLDEPGGVQGAAFETLVFQELRATSSLMNWDAELFFWRSHAGEEVDFVLYGKDAFVAIECKLASRIRPEDLKGLRAFREEHPKAKTVLIYGGDKRLRFDHVSAIPAREFFPDLEQSILSD